MTKINNYVDSFDIPAMSKALASEETDIKKAYSLREQGKYKEAIEECDKTILKYEALEKIKNIRAMLLEKTKEDK
jgi:hypothetical protein